MEIINRKISELSPADYNPRKLSKDQEADITESLKKFGLVDPIIINTYPGREGVIVGGHQRIKICKKLGLKEVPTVEVRLNSDDERELNVRLNKNIGDWDFVKLDSLFDTGSLIEWGFKSDELNFNFFGDVDFIPDVTETDIQLGDLFEIGKHRFLCGDSTKEEDVSKLLEGDEPFLMITDPPYGVNYDADWRNKASRLNGKSYGATAIGKVINDNTSSWLESYQLSPSKVSYIWHADRHASQIAKDLLDCGFEIRNQIIWAKNNIVIGRGAYHWQHEPCWYAVKKGSKANWIGGRKQSTVWKIDKPLKSETGHSTQKPVECMLIPMKNHKGDVYDPFIGSGTTMVAAQQLQRKCYGMELSPEYCQLVINRMVGLDRDIKIKKI